MIVRIPTSAGLWQADLETPWSLALPIVLDGSGDNAFGLPPASQAPFAAGTFVGDTAAGGSCNCRGLRLHPHGDGTHTESAQHIDAAAPHIAQVAPTRPQRAVLLTVPPHVRPDGESVVEAADVARALKHVPAEFLEAVVLRTRPAPGYHRWSGANPPWLAPETLELLADAGVEHLVLDLPSVDREDDGGRLTAHHRWWAGTRARRATITEMAHIPAALADGPGLLFLGIAPLATDAAPSRPVFFAAQPVA